jgi:hypothetical protein
MPPTPAPGRPPGPLRLAQAGDAKPAWITLLTTEHYNLQTQRAATVAEANGRASVFLGAVSAGLIALGFQGVGTGHTAGTMIFQLLVLTSLTFLGLTAFGRCLEVSVDDWEFATRIARLRAAYTELVPELAATLALAAGDEEYVVMLTGRWQPLQKMLSVAGSVAVLTSVLFGADVGVLLYGFDHSLASALAAGGAAGATVVVLTARYQWSRWCQASPGQRRQD